MLWFLLLPPNTCYFVLSAVYVADINLRLARTLSSTPFPPVILLGYLYVPPILSSIYPNVLILRVYPLTNYKIYHPTRGW